MRRDRVSFKFFCLHIEGEGRPAMAMAYIGALVVIVLVGWHGVEVVSFVSTRFGH